MKNIKGISKRKSTGKYQVSVPDFNGGTKYLGVFTYEEAVSTRLTWERDNSWVEVKSFKSKEDFVDNCLYEVFGELYYKVNANQIRKGTRADKLQEVTEEYKRFVVKFYGKPILSHQIVWYIHNKVWPNGEIDHENGDPTDNRINNLRLADRRTNMRNTKLRKGNKSGLHGVRWRKDKSRWECRINSDQGLEIKHFDNLLDASCWRKSKEAEYGYHINHGRINIDG